MLIAKCFEKNGEEIVKLNLKDQCGFCQNHLFANLSRNLGSTECFCSLDIEKKNNQILLSRGFGKD